MEREKIIEFVEKIERAMENNDMDVNDKYDLSLTLYERCKVEKIDYIEGMEDEVKQEDLGEFERDDEENSNDSEDSEEYEEEHDEVEDEMEKELGSELKEPKKKKSASIIKKPKISIKK